MNNYIITQFNIVYASANFKNILFYDNLKYYFIDAVTSILMKVTITRPPILFSVKTDLIHSLNTPSLIYQTVKLGLVSYHWVNYISISFHIERDMIDWSWWQFFFGFRTKWISIWFQNRKENCHHDHIPFNVKENGNIVFSVRTLREIFPITFKWEGIRS